MRIRFVIGGVVIALLIIWGAYAFLRTTVRYVPLEKALSAEHTIQVLGKIDRATVNYDAERSRLEFVIYDVDAEDEAAAERLSVVYHGSVPGNFDQATSVVLKGKGDNSVFVAEQMLVKCPSKYQGTGGNDYQDIRSHRPDSDDSGD